MFNIAGFTLSLIGSAGYGGLFALSLLESAAIPIPSEIVLPFSGFLAVSGRFNLITVVIVASVANLVGSLILFYIGRSGGRWFLEKYGKYILVYHKDLEAGDRWFREHGRGTVFWSRMLPVVRTFVSLPAGISEMNAAIFGAYTFFGALPWNFALAFMGYKAGEHWDVLSPYFHRADIAIGAMIIVLAAWYIIKKRKHA